MLSRSKFYDINADLKVFEEKTNGSKTIRFLQGDLNLDPGALDYQITKALLFSDNKRNLILTIAAEGTPSGNGIDTSGGDILGNTDKAADKITSDSNPYTKKIKESL